MVSTYPDIAIRPGIASYPLVNKKTNGMAETASADAAAFQRILGMPAPSASVAQPANSAASTPSATPSPMPSTSSTGHMTFMGFLKDVLDVINPLQHIPIISAIYQHITGDKITPEAEFIGDALYGGPIGGAVAAVNIAYREETGKSIGQTVIADLTGQQAAQPGAQVMMAQNTSATSPAANSKQASADDIIWWDAPTAPAARVALNTAPSSAFQIASAQKSSSLNNSSLSLPSTMPGTTEGEPASPSTAPPVLQPKGAASTIVLHTQEAPAGKARKAMPPELIAQKMMEGLQKYAAMKHTSLAPSLSALY